MIHKGDRLRIWKLGRAGTAISDEANGYVSVLMDGDTKPKVLSVSMNAITKEHA